MKTVIMALMLTVFAFGQRINQDDFRSLFGFINEVAVKENLIKINPDGTLYIEPIDETQVDVFYEKYYSEYIELFTFETRDLLLGSLYSSLSGVGLGLLESHAFGYKYPGLGDGWFKDYLTMSTAGDQLLKFWHPNKVGRGLNDIFDRQAYKKWEKYFGQRWYFTYAIHFIIKNSIASIYRGWAKYDKPFFYYELDLDLEWLSWRLFGN